MDVTKVDLPEPLSFTAKPGALLSTSATVAPSCQGRASKFFRRPSPKLMVSETFCSDSGLPIVAETFFSFFSGRPSLPWKRHQKMPASTRASNSGRRHHEPHREHEGEDSV